MDVSSARSRLAGDRFGAVDWVAETGSTNDDLLAAAREGASERVRVADLQTAGRGRLGRRWEAPIGASLLCSVLVRPELAPSRAHLVPWAVALAAADAVDAVCDVAVRLKWPNDLVAPGPATDDADRKVAGVLSELVVDRDVLDAVVVGIGLNVNWRGGFPPELAATSASLDGLCGHDVDRADLLVAMLRSFTGWLGRAEAGEPLHTAVAERSATLGRRIRVELPSGHLVGRAVELAADGALVVEADDGSRTPVTVGDIVHLRIH